MVAGMGETQLASYETKTQRRKDAKDGTKIFVVQRPVKNDRKSSRHRGKTQWAHAGILKNLCVVLCVFASLRFRFYKEKQCRR